MKNRIFPLLMLSVFLASCGDKEKSDYSLIDNFKDSKTLSFIATINQRSGDIVKSFSDNDVIAIYGSLYNGATAEPFDAQNSYISNAEYTLANNLFSHRYGQYFIGEKMDLYGYTPYMNDFNSKISKFTIPVDQRVGYSNCDLMYAEKIGCATMELPAALEFSHLFAKIEINLTQGASISSLNGLEIKVKNAVNVVKIEKGEVTPIESTGDLTPFKVDGNKYEIIIAPQTIASGVSFLEFTFGKEVSTWKTNTPLNFAASTLIKIDVTVESGYLDVTVSGNIDGWGDDDDPITGTIN